MTTLLISRVLLVRRGQPRRRPLPLLSTGADAGTEATAWGLGEGQEHVEGRD